MPGLALTPALNPTCVASNAFILSVQHLPPSVHCVLRTDNYNDVGHPVNGDVTFSAPITVPPADIKLEWYTDAACTHYIAGSDLLVQCTGPAPPPPTTVPTTVPPPTSSEICCGPFVGQVFGPIVLMMHVDADVKCVLNPGDYSHPHFVGPGGNLTFPPTGLAGSHPEVELYADLACTQFLHALTCCVSSTSAGSGNYCDAPYADQCPFVVPA